MHIRTLVIGALLPIAQVTGQQQQIPVRKVTEPLAVSQEVLRTPIGGVRALPGERLLANDQLGRRLLLLDSTLALANVVIDSVAGLANSYPRTGGALVRYRGDTTLFPDFDARALLVISPSGEVGRVMAPPKPQDLTLMRIGATSDPHGALIYRGVLRNPTPPPTDGNRILTPVAQPDTQPIVRADFDTRRVDTLAWFKVATTTGSRIERNPTTGAWTMQMRINPVPPASDEWAALANGTVAVLRAHDYHIDWIEPGGARRASPKMPYDWVRLTDEQKQAKVDSAKRIMDSVTAAGGSPMGALMMPGPDGTQQRIIPTIEYAPISEIPDYIPPFRNGAMKADEDGNLWILPTMSAAARGGLLYDVVNEQGELFERVQLPAGRTLLGFGRGGTVYVARSEPSRRGWVIEKMRVIREAITQ